MEKGCVKGMYRLKLVSSERFKGLMLYLLTLVSLTFGAHAQDSYSSCPVCLCVCVCVSVFSILPSCVFRRPTRGISGYSAVNAVNLKSRFL